MQIVLMQKSCVCADVARNLECILESCEVAQQEEAALLITPYFFLTGFPLLDILDHDFLFEAIEHAIKKLSTIKELAILLSYPKQYEDGIGACCTVIYNGQLLHQSRIPLEGKLLESSEVSQFCFQGLNFSLLYTGTSNDLRLLNTANVIVFQSMHPFYASLHHDTIDYMQRITSIANVPILTINPLGITDQYIYAGASFSLDKKGHCQFQAAYFTEQNYLLTWQDDTGFIGHQALLYNTRIQLLYHAIIFAMQTYLHNNGFKKVCLGLSGGVDSAVVLALACQAVGSKNCEVLLMPSLYTSNLSNDLAISAAHKLQVVYSVVPITGLYSQYKSILMPRFKDLPEDSTEENLQARIRGTLLMALSNKTGAILLCTGNKSEAAVGYCTLYGDTNGGFAPIKDLYKTEVYEMARWINQFYQEEIIPQAIIERKPSAELKFNQTDQDSLPEYSLLDEIIELVLRNQSVENIVTQGYEKNTVCYVMKLIRNSEFKRKQGVMGPQLSHRSFGREWNYPITRLSNHF